MNDAIEVTAEKLNPTSQLPARTDDRMLKWFECGHLPTHLQAVSQDFEDTALLMCEVLEPGPERTVCLRKLLEAKDAAVRAMVHSGG